MKFIISIKQQTQSQNVKGRNSLYKSSNDKNMYADNGLETLDELLELSSIKIFCNQCEKDITRETIVIAEEEKEVAVVEEKKNNVSVVGVGGSKPVIGINCKMNRFNKDVSEQEKQQTNTRRRGRPSQVDLLNRRNMNKNNLLAADIKKKQGDQQNTQQINIASTIKVKQQKKQPKISKKKQKQITPPPTYPRITRNRALIQNTNTDTFISNQLTNSKKLSANPSNNPLITMAQKIDNSDKILQQQFINNRNKPNQQLQNIMNQQNNQPSQQQSYINQNIQQLQSSQQRSIKQDLQKQKQCQKKQSQQKKISQQQEEYNQQLSQNDQQQSQDKEQYQRQKQQSEISEQDEQQQQLEQDEPQENDIKNNNQGVMLLQQQQQKSMYDQMNRQQNQQRQEEFRQRGNDDIEDIDELELIVADRRVTSNNRSSRHDNREIFGQDEEDGDCLINYGNENQTIRNDQQNANNQPNDLSQKHPQEQRKQYNIAHRLYCVSCFANLQEFPEAYQFRKSLKYASVNSQWTFYDEIVLLNGLIAWGFGNWGQIKEFMDYNSCIFDIKEIENHYQKVYMQNQGPDFLKQAGLGDNPNIHVPKKKTLQDLLYAYYYPNINGKPYARLNKKISSSSNQYQQKNNQNYIPRRGRPPSLSVQQKKQQTLVSKISSQGQKQKLFQTFSKQTTSNQPQKTNHPSSLIKISNHNSNTSLLNNNVSSTSEQIYQTRTRRREKIQVQAPMKKEQTNNQKQDIQVESFVQQSQSENQSNDGEVIKLVGCGKSLNEVHLKPRSSSKMLPNPTQGGKSLKESHPYSNGVRPSYKMNFNEQKQNQSNNYFNANAQYIQCTALAPTSSTSLLKGQNVYSYNPKRRQFQIIQYDYYAQSMLAYLQFNEQDTPQQQQLKIKIIQQYNHRLDQRIKRRQFVIQHRLLDTQYMVKKLRKYSKNTSGMRFVEPFRRLIDTNQKYYQIVDRYNQLCREKGLMEGLVKIYRKLSQIKKEPKFADVIEYLNKKKQKKQLLGHRVKSDSQNQRKVFIKDYKKDLKKKSNQYSSNNNNMQQIGGPNSINAQRNNNFVPANQPGSLSFTNRSNRSEQRQLRTSAVVQNYASNQFTQRSDDQNCENNGLQSMGNQNGNQNIGINNGAFSYSNHKNNANTLIIPPANQSTSNNQYFLSSLLSQDDSLIIKKYLLEKKRLQQSCIEQQQKDQFDQNIVKVKLDRKYDLIGMKLPIKLSKGFYLKQLK